MIKAKLYLAVPMLFNAAMRGILVAYFNAKFAGIDERFDDSKTSGARNFTRARTGCLCLKDRWRCRANGIQT